MSPFRHRLTMKGPGVQAAYDIVYDGRDVVLDGAVFEPVGPDASRPVVRAALIRLFKRDTYEHDDEVPAIVDGVLAHV